MREVMAPGTLDPIKIDTGVTDRSGELRVLAIFVFLFDSYTYVLYFIIQCAARITRHRAISFLGVSLCLVFYF